MLWDLFWTFFKLGFVSFGGGYAMLPVIEHEVLSHQWLTASQYTEAVALAGMAPGPIAMNSAVYVGYTAAGWPGSLMAAFGIALPSAIIMFAVATFFYRVYDNHWVQSALDGMKPAVVALIALAAVNMTRGAGYLDGWTVSSAWPVILFIAALFALIRLRLHPITVIILSGIAGMVIYG